MMGISVRRHRACANKIYLDIKIKSSKFGPQMAYTVSLVSDTSRSPTLRRPSSWQGEREMSAPRQVLSTQLCSHPAINYLYISIYIPQNFIPYGSCIVSWYGVRCTFAICVCAFLQPLSPRARAIVVTKASDLMAAPDPRL